MLSAGTVVCVPRTESVGVADTMIEADVFAVNLLMSLSLFALNPTKCGHCFSSLSLQTEHLYTFRNIGTVESSVTTRQVNSQFMRKYI